MCKKTKADQLRSTVNLLSTLRKLDVEQRRHVLLHLDKTGITAIRTCLINCLDVKNCDSHVAELLKPHLIKKEKTLRYLIDVDKNRPTKLNRAKIAELDESLEPLLDVSIISMSRLIQQLSERAASKKKKGTCSSEAKKKAEK